MATLQTLSTNEAYIVRTASETSLTFLTVNTSTGVATSTILPSGATTILSDRFAVIFPLADSSSVATIIKGALSISPISNTTSTPIVTVSGTTATYSLQNIPASTQYIAVKVHHSVGGFLSEMTVAQGASAIVNAADYGVIGDGVTGITTQLTAAAVATGAKNGILQLGRGTFILDTPFTASAACTIRGLGKDITTLKYTGTGTAVTLAGAQINLEALTVETTADAAKGVVITAPVSKSFLRNVIIISSPVAATNTGVGLHFDATSGGTILGVTLDDVYVLGYKTGLKTTGTDANNTVTSITGVNVWFVGRAAGVVANSKAIDMDANTNGVASTIFGGTIESFVTGISCATGSASGMGLGISYVGDFEKNTTNYSVGSTYNGEIWNLLSGEHYQQSTNGTANLWYQDRDKDGERIRETYYNQRHVIYTGGGAVQEFSLYRGASLIGGGSPALQWGMFCDGGTSPTNNYMYLKSGKLSYTDNTGLAPTTGTWTTGDIVFNYIHGSGTNSKDGVSYYQCIATGTPGTWQPVHYDIEGAVSWTPGLIGAGAQVTQDITINGYGIDFTSFVKCQPPGALGGLILQAFVDSATVIRLTLYNPTAGGLTGPAGSYKVRVQI